MELTVEISTDRAAGLKFDEFPEQARQRLRAAITGLIGELEGRIQSAEPSLTGKLRSETEPVVEEYPNRITGRVSITADFAKAAALEYGAHATVLVKAHSASLDHIYGKFVDPMTVLVAAHARKVNIGEHRFLRGPLAAMEGQILESLQQALTDAAGE